MPGQVDAAPSTATQTVAVEVNRKAREEHFLVAISKMMSLSHSPGGLRRRRLAFDLTKSPRTDCGSVTNAIKASAACSKAAAFGCQCHERPYRRRGESVASWFHTFETNS
jgi:hypothetical protein